MRAQLKLTSDLERQLKVRIVELEVKLEALKAELKVEEARLKEAREKKP